jgi:hypothetical protein
MAVRGVPYIYPIYSPFALVVQRQTRVGAPSREGTNQISAWPGPEGTSVLFSIHGEVSLVTLHWVAPMWP